MNKILTDSGNLIEKVELYSIGGLCAPDLTGSCHVVIITYEDKVQRLIQLEAGFWQNKKSQHKNTLFPEILGEIMPGCIMLSHEHLDHAGRLVKMHKALKQIHQLKGVPIIMSEASGKLLPYVLEAIHAVNMDSLGAFDQDVSRFDAQWNKFEREYTRKPQKVQPRGTDHRPNGERVLENKRNNEVLLDTLYRSFKEWGGVIGETGVMTIPPQVGKIYLQKLSQIKREVQKLQKPENSGALSTNESHHFQEIKNALSRLFLDGDIFDKIDQMFEQELPRHNRQNRSGRIETAKKLIDEAIATKRKILLPDITHEDIYACVVDTKCKPLEKKFDIPGVPHATGMLHHTGHVLGSASVELVFKMTGGSVKKLLFSGDIGSWNKPTIHGMPKLPQHAIDRVLMESTRAGKNHMDTGIEIAKIVDFIRTHKGPILMPVFSFDRLFVVLHALRDEMISGRITCPIYSRNRLAKNTQHVYEEYYPELTEVLSKIIPLSGQAGGKEAYDLMGSNQHCIILASGGTLIESSSAHGLLQYRAETGKDIHMIFTGYQPGELGAEIMNFVLDPFSGEKKSMRIGAHEAEIIKENILCTGIFSGHGDHNDLVRFSKIGSQVSLIHGNPKTAPTLAREIEADIVPREQRITIF